MRALLFLVSAALVAQAPPEPKVYKPTVEERAQVARRAAELDAALGPLRTRGPADLVADVEIYLKAAQWILRYDEFYTQAYVSQALTVLDTGLARAREMVAGKPSWPERTGCLSRAYRSRVDGSVQPYALTIPPNYSKSNPEWLEVVLHGRGATLNEVNFLYTHDRAKPAQSDHQFMRLDIFGRGNNAYRWAGETDVFEAIESVKKRYNIDPDRIVLRGFSMGGAGAWHIGLHHPDQWAAVEAGAGFVETKRYAKVAEPPPYVHIYDALDYALNAVNLATVGYGGEIDPQLAASTEIREALVGEGYELTKEGMNYASDEPRLLFLVGPQTQHKWHPDSLAKSNGFVMHNQSRARGSSPSLRFVTYTERYNHAFYLTVDQLEHQYQRAQVDFAQDGDVTNVKTTNVARMTIHGEPPLETYRIDGRDFQFNVDTTFERFNGAWRQARKQMGLQKKHGLQGPIDDAFMDSFICVRPGDAPSEVHRFAASQLERFVAEFPKWMRGDVRVKEESRLTVADQREANVVAFGTPSTSKFVASAVAASPIRWTGEWIVAGRQRFAASTHMLSMIYPNPAAPNRYIVLNSGHTFHEVDFRGTNALLYPRVGDWAVTEIGSGKVVAEGVFDRHWKLDGGVAVR